MGVTRLPGPEVHEIQEKLEQFAGSSKWAPEEFQWHVFRVRPEPYEVPGLGDVYVVNEFHDLDYSDFSGPRWKVFRIGDRYFRITGRNISHVGEDWEYARLVEVQGTEVTQISWTTHWDLA